MWLAHLAAWLSSAKPHIQAILADLQIILVELLLFGVFTYGLLRLVMAIIRRDSP
jgi:hypothetical protein